MRARYRRTMAGRGSQVAELSSVSSAKNTEPTSKKSVKKKEDLQKAGVEIPTQDAKSTGARATHTSQSRKTPEVAPPPPSSSNTSSSKSPADEHAERAALEKVPKSSIKKLDRTDPHRILQDTLEKLKIKKQERCESTKCVNEIEKIISEHLKKNLDWCKEISLLKTGSHYENVKICQPDEFDVMLTIPVERVEVQHFGEEGAFYSVAMKRQKHPLNRFLNEDNTIKASEMLAEFRDKVKEVVPTIPHEIEVERKRKGCPAVTLEVKQNRKKISIDFVLSLEVNKSSWPSFTANGFMVDNWLGKKVKQDLKRKQFYLVPKYEGIGSAEKEGVVAKDTWRISFSHVEKIILNDHGASKTCCQKGSAACCRKPCLKLLKYLLQRLTEDHPKEMSKFCSYHAKTALLHACATRVKDSEWAADQLSHCFQLLLEDFEKHLRRKELHNFFIPSHNLLESTDKKSCEFLATRIEYQRNNGFPLFC
ncbi:cyclic GMP-AMP synthase isoform X4 [Brachyhypopomus gauderio]|uniref:cyclic GMP-AMP synthase isoform X4 n=1 Tax=Brachyhypopomus gauderio TaxID=698409 RepID=UPI0040412A91